MTPTPEHVDLLIAALLREFPGVPYAQLLTWTAEGRVTQADWVRPTGSHDWLPAGTVPWLAPYLPPSDAAPAELVQNEFVPVEALPVEALPAEAITAEAVTPEIVPKPPSRPAAVQPVRVQPVRVTPVAVQPAGRKPAAVVQTPSAIGAVPPTPAGSPPPPDFEDGPMPTAFRRRPVEDSEMDMTPMIDVTFQLLIFFMLSNTLSSAAAVLVPQALHGRGVTPEGKQTLMVDDQGALYLGESLDDASRRPTIAALVAEVSQNAKTFADQNNNSPLDVILSAHRQAKHQVVRDLVEELGKVPNVGQVLLGVEEMPR